MSDFNNFGGGAELTASFLNDLIEEIRRNARMRAVAPLEIIENSSGAVLRYAEESGGFSEPSPTTRPSVTTLPISYGIITGRDTVGGYEWEELELSAQAFGRSPIIGTLQTGSIQTFMYDADYEAGSVQDDMDGKLTFSLQYTDNTKDPPESEATDSFTPSQANPLTAAAVQAALEGLSLIGEGNVIVSRATRGSCFDTSEINADFPGNIDTTVHTWFEVRFIGDLANKTISPLTVLGPQQTEVPVVVIVPGNDIASNAAYEINGLTTIAIGTEALFFGFANGGETRWIFQSENIDPVYAYAWPYDPEANIQPNPCTVSITVRDAIQESALNPADPSSGNPALWYPAFAKINTQQYTSYPITLQWNLSYTGGSGSTPAPAYWVLQRQTIRGDGSFDPNPPEFWPWTLDATKFAPQYAIMPPIAPQVPQTDAETIAILPGDVLEYTDNILYYNPLGTGSPTIQYSYTTTAYDSNGNLLCSGDLTAQVYALQRPLTWCDRQWTSIVSNGIVPAWPSSLTLTISDVVNFGAVAGRYTAPFSSPGSYSGPVGVCGSGSTVTIDRDSATISNNINGSLEFTWPWFDCPFSASGAYCQTFLSTTPFLDGIFQVPPPCLTQVVPGQPYGSFMPPVYLVKFQATFTVTE